MLYKGVTANFYTWDLGSLMRRLVSITADPLATAHLICLGLLVNLTVYFKSGCQKNKIYVCVNILLLGGCILGLSKGTVVYLAVFVVGILYHKFQKNISKKKMMLFISILIFVAVILMIVMYTNTEVPTAITNHIDGFINGLKDSNLFGKGLGIAGAATHAI